MSHSAAAGTSSDARHGLRIFLIWLPLAIIADLLIWFVWYPHLPPGRMSDQAQGQQFDIAVMAMLAVPGRQVGAGPSPAPAPAGTISWTVPKTNRPSTITAVAVIQVAWTLVLLCRGGPSSSSPGRRRQTMMA